jgi:hypothetical protein
LLIQTPDGTYACNENTNPVLRDPTVTLTKPAQGRYNIWLGSALARDLIPGFLVFTGQGDVSAGGLALQSLVKRPAQPEVLPLSHRRRLQPPAWQSGCGGQDCGEAGARWRTPHRSGDGEG